MNDSVKYDNPTSKWFENHIGKQTTVCKCDKCGLFHKPSLGHKCNRKDNPELLGEGVMKGASVLSKERLTERYKGKPICPRNIKCVIECDECEHMKKMVDKLSEYEDLEEQGLILRLPCKVGDTVYSFSFGKVFSAEVVEVKYICEAENYGKFIRQRITIDGEECGITIIDFSDIGERYFLTQSEAEEKLRELEG